MTDVHGPPAQGVRVEYDELPAALRAWVDEALGSPVVEAVTQPGGFSPGAAARVRCADGRRAFVKAVSADVNPYSRGMHRTEVRVLSLLPESLPVPRLLASYDVDPWVALLIEDVDGRHPSVPWQPDELDRMLRLADEVNAVTGLGLPQIGARFRTWPGWHDLAPEAVDQLDEWSRRHLEWLVDLTSSLEVAVAGDHLLHGDLRGDNVLLSGIRDWLVDWPGGTSGAQWVDVVLTAPSIAMQGGPPPEEVIAARTSAADRDAVTVLVAAITGYLVHNAYLPPPPGLPTVRAFQAAQGEIALRWLRERTGWP